LILAHARLSLHEDVLHSVRGCVFFGVPHRGADVAYWASWGANLLKILQLGFSTNTNFVDALGTTFSEISEQFIERAHRFKILTFYETDKIFNQQVR
jgi:hypothetical protein